MNPSNVKQGAKLKKERVGKDEWVGRPSKKLSSIQSGSCCLLGPAAEEEVKEQQQCALCTAQCAMCTVHALKASLLKAGRMQINTASFLDQTLGFLKLGKVEIENESLPTEREGSGAAHTHEQMIWSQPFSAAFLFIRFTNHLFRRNPSKISTKKEVNH